MISLEEIIKEQQQIKDEFENLKNKELIMYKNFFFHIIEEICDVSIKSSLDFFIFNHPLSNTFSFKILNKDKKQFTIFSSEEELNSDYTIISNTNSFFNSNPNIEEQIAQQVYNLILKTCTILNNPILKNNIKPYILKISNGERINKTDFAILKEFDSWKNKKELEIIPPSSLYKKNKI